MNLINNDRITRIISVALAVIFGVLVITLAANAITTISTNIDTDGTLTVDLTSTLTGDVTMGGGNGALTLTTANDATSTITVGCIQTYATSTASPIKQMFFASSTLNIDGASVTAGFGGGTMGGMVLWGFGTCP